MKTVYTFEAEARERVGKGASRTLRREGRLPAVLYGKGQEPVSFSIDHNAFMQAYLKGGFNNKLVDIKIGGKSHHVLAREIQAHPVTDVPEHVDFLKVDENSRVHVNVPVKLVNAEKCLGVKRGGALNIVRHDIEFVCAPDAIPSVIAIDVAELGIGDSLHISSVELPKGVTSAISDRDFTIVTVTGRGGKADVADDAADAAEGEAAEKAE